MERDVGDGLGPHHLRIGVAEQLVAEIDQEPAILDRQAHDLREHPHRDLGGHGLDPVELVAHERAVEDLAGESADPLLVGVDHPRRESLVDDRPQAGVPGRVGVDHRLPQLELLRCQILQRGTPGLGRVRLVVLRRGDDVLVARERPEAAALALVLPVERRVAAEKGEPVVRDALDPPVEVGEVDVVECEPLEQRAGDGGPDGLRLLPALGGGRARRLRRCEADLELAVDDACLVDRQRLERGR